MLIAETFKALGDPMRLKIIERLSSGSLFTLGSVSKDLGLTRQGARKHLQILANAALVKLEPSGRNTMVTLTPESLRAANSFISQLERKWDNRLNALKEFTEQNPLKKS